MMNMKKQRKVVFLVLLFLVSMLSIGGISPAAAWDEDPYEPNNFMPEATDIMMFHDDYMAGPGYQEWFYYTTMLDMMPGEEDWFMLPVPTGATIEFFILEWIAGPSMGYIEVLNGVGDIFFSDIAFEGLSFSFVAPVNDMYFFRFFSDNFEQIKYAFDLVVLDPVIPDEIIITQIDST